MMIQESVLETSKLDLDYYKSGAANDELIDEKLLFSSGKKSVSADDLAVDDVMDSIEVAIPIEDNSKMNAMVSGFISMAV